MVFQNYALYPTLSCTTTCVRPEDAQFEKPEIDKRVLEAGPTSSGIGELLRRKPPALRASASAWR